MNKPFYVGIAGYARCGKDTAAQLLIENLQRRGFKAIRRALADELKEECAEAMSPIVGIPYDELLRQFYGTTEEKQRWRILLQWWGTEFRRVDNDNYWLDALENYISELEDVDVVVIPDVRFPNEAELCQKHLGIVINVVRPGIVTSEHSSENALNDYDEWNFVINNDRDIAFMNEQIEDEIIPMFLILDRAKDYEKL